MAKETAGTQGKKLHWLHDTGEAAIVAWVGGLPYTQAALWRRWQRGADVPDDWREWFDQQVTEAA